MTHTTKHTPGPWAVEPRQWDHGASLAIVAPHNGYIVAIVPFDEDIQIVDEPDSDTVRRHSDELPNAVMLAAAPAMYEALTIALQIMIDKRVPYQHEIDQARAALAQAEGRG